MTRCKKIITEKANLKIKKQARNGDDYCHAAGMAEM